MKTVNKLEYLEVNPKGKPEACVVWLHGLGADGYDFVDVVPSLNLPEGHNIRFIFPHAPQRPITINAGMVMPGWYDILGLTMKDPHDEVGIKASEQLIFLLLQDIFATGIPSDRIILMGFSQGGALSLHSALRFPQRLGGVAALSAYLPLDSLLPQERHPANAALPIFMAHGMADPVVPYLMGLHASQQLEKLGYSVEWHAYPILHTVCMPELADISHWIQRILL